MDPAWQNHVALAVATVDKENTVRVLRHWLDVELALLPLVSAEGFESKFELITKLRTLIGEILAPWLDTGGNAIEEAIQKAASLWEEEYGDLDDPETQRRINATVEALRERRKRNE